MSTTIATLIDNYDALIDNSYSDANKLVWINDVESGIYEHIQKERLVQYYNRGDGTYMYSLPSGCLWSDVEGVKVDGKKYLKKSVMNNDIYSFYYEQSKLNIYPIPDVNDVTYTSGTNEISFKAISYTSAASEITFTHNKITTTGTAFTDSAFVVGMTVTVSGCLTTTGNNKTAIITVVAASVLTFSDNSFTANTTADTGTVNLACNGIYASGAILKGFVAEEVTLVSGCTDETANNIYSVVFAVADNFLTFASGTFTAETSEAAAVTITQPNIKMVYKYRRTAKAADTEALLLPDAFFNIYRDYFSAQIAKYNGDDERYNNFVGYYNAGLDEYENWYEANREQDVANIPEDAWGYGVDE